MHKFLCHHCEYDNDCDRISDVNSTKWNNMALFDITIIKNDTNTWFRTEIHNVCFISHLYSSIEISTVLNT